MSDPSKPAQRPIRSKGDILPEGEKRPTRARSVSPGRVTSNKENTHVRAKSETRQSGFDRHIVSKDDILPEGEKRPTRERSVSPGRVISNEEENDVLCAKLSNDDYGENEIAPNIECHDSQKPGQRPGSTVRARTPQSVFNKKKNQKVKNAIRMEVQMPKKLTPEQQKSMSQKLTSKLNHLRIDLDISKSKVEAWLNGNGGKALEQLNYREVHDLGTSLVSNLLTREIVNKNDILSVLEEERPTRACSVSPGRATSNENTPVRTKAQTRKTRFDRHKNDVLCAKLDYDDYGQNEMEHLVHLPSSPRRLKKELEELREENAGLIHQLKTVEDSMVSRELYSDLVEDLTAYHQDIQKLENYNTSLKKQIAVLEREIELNKREEGRSDRVIEIEPEWQTRATRYREERNAAQAENKILRQEFKKLKADTGDDKACVNYKKDNLQKEIAYFKKKLKETQDNLSAATEELEVLQRTNYNQKKFIEEMHSRSTNAEEVFSEANAAIAHYNEETERYKGINEKFKLDATKLKMEKEELQIHMQKLRQLVKEEKDDSSRKMEALNQQVNALEAEKMEHFKKIEVLTTTNAWLKTKKRSGQIDSSEQRDDQIYIVLKSKNEELERNYMELEERLSLATTEHIESEQKFKNEMNRYRSERNKYQEKVRHLEKDYSDVSARLREQQNLFSIEKENLEGSIRNLKNRLAQAENQPTELRDYGKSVDGSDFQRDEMDRKNEEIVQLTRKLYRKEEELRDLKSQVVALEAKQEDHTHRFPQSRSERERYSPVGSKRLSDIGKENESLRKELTEAIYALEQSKNTRSNNKKLEEENNRLKNLEKDKDALEIDNSRLREQIGELQNQWDKLKFDRIHQKENVTSEISSLKVQKLKLENDKLLMRDEIMSLKERLKDAEAGQMFGKNMESENKNLQKTVQNLKNEIRTLEDKFKLETETRIRGDGTIQRYTDDNDRLRREISAAQHELHKITRERDDLVKQCQHEVDPLRCEIEKVTREKEELSVLYKAQLRQEEEKIVRLEKEKEELQSRIAPGELSHQHSAYELLQLKNDYEICKSEKARIQEELDDVRQDYEELERQKKLPREERRSCSSCESYKIQLDRIRRENRDLVSRLSSVTIDERQKRAECEEYEQKLAQARKDKAGLEALLTLLQGQRCEKCEEYKVTHQKKEFEFQDLQRRLTKEENRKCIKCDEYERKLTQWKKDYQDLQDRFNVAKTYAANTGKDVHELREQIEAEKINIKNLQRKMESLEREKATAEQALRDQDAEVKKLRGETASCDRKIQIINDEKSYLEKRCRSREEALVGMDADNRQLKAEKRHLESDIVTLKHDKETLIHKLEAERENKMELQERLRLSEAACNNVGDEISEIPYLCDVNRPTSLAKKFSSLYTDEYTDALEEIEDTMDESSSAKVMLDWLKICHEWCEKLANDQRQFMKDKAIGFMEDHMKFRVPVQISERCLIHVKEFQKNIAIDSLAAVTQICLHKSLSGQRWSDNTPIKKYIQRCTELCWMMQINDPPLYVKFDVTPGQSLDKNSYNIFTRSGSQIDYVVWPVLFLHRTGPMLGKGVAQGK